MSMFQDLRIIILYYYHYHILFRSLFYATKRATPEDNLYRSYNGENNYFVPLNAICYEIYLRVPDLVTFVPF